jgi:hypothetical protein
VSFPSSHGQNGQVYDIRAYELHTRKLRNIAVDLQFQIPSDLSASPDGRWFLYWQLDRSGSNSIVADSN